MICTYLQPSFALLTSVKAKELKEHYASFCMYFLYPSSPSEPSSIKVLLYSVSLALSV